MIKPSWLDDTWRWCNEAMRDEVFRWAHEIRSYQWPPVYSPMVGLRVSRPDGQDWLFIRKANRWVDMDRIQAGLTDQDFETRLTILAALERETDLLNPEKQGPHDAD